MRIFNILAGAVPGDTKFKSSAAFETSVPIPQKGSFMAKKRKDQKRGAERNCELENDVCSPC